MSDQWVFMLAMTCSIPAVTGLLVYKHIHQKFQPLVYIMVLAAVTELLIRWSMMYKAPLISGYVITNLFLLANTGLHILLFFNLQVINKQTGFIIFFFFLTSMIINGIYLGTLNGFYFYTSCAASIIILFLAVEGLTKQTFRSKEKWSRDFIFLFCLITVLYNANVIFYFSIVFLGISAELLKGNILEIYRYINATCNVLFIWPVLCIPRNRSYIRLFW